MARLNLVERRMSRFLHEPPSVRNAASVIVTLTAIVVGIGGVLMRILDHREYPNIGRGLWWAMQTVTTVGYGDVTPHNASGRIIATAVMLWGIAFLSISIAAITSTFVARAAKEQAEKSGQDESAELADLRSRLERIEQLLLQRTDG
ncbi:MAG TPA: potassium channel family protein [Gaiellaceae bacterium]